MLSKIKFLFLLLLLSIFCKINAIDNFNFRAEAKKISDVVIQEILKDYSLYCDGIGGSMPDNLRSIAVSFVAYRKGSIEEAREIEVKAIQKIVKLINEDEKLRHYLCEFPFPTRGIEISISYNKQDDGFYPVGELAFVSHINGILRYRTYDSKTDRFVLLYDEPFEEACKLVQTNKITSKEPKIIL